MADCAVLNLSARILIYDFLILASFDTFAPKF